jgi:hypothetical protein
VDGRTDEVAFGPVVTLDLGKRGIRDIAWSPAHHAYLIEAGQAKDEKPGAGFALFTWDGTGSPREIEALRGVLDVNPDFHPEAVVPLLERSGDALKPSKRVLIVSDDGTRPLPSGKNCKSKKVSEAEKSFRAVILDVD